MSLSWFVSNASIFQWRIFNLEKSCLNFVKILFESIFFMKSVEFVNCKSLFQIFCKSYSQEFVSLSCFISNASIIQLRIFFFFSMIYHLHINLKKYYTLLYLGKLKNNIKQCIGKYIGFALIRS